MNMTSESEEFPKKSYPLHKAVEYKNVHKVKILLPYTQDINEKDEGGNSVLHLVCERSYNEEILELLLNRDDIDASVMNNNGLTALHSLAFGGNLPGIIKLLKRFPSLHIDVEGEGKETPLIMATLTNNLDVILYLLSLGANVNHGTQKKFTALHYAANNGYTACAQMLIDHGADVNAKDDYQQTALMKSCKWGFLETCKLLLSRGAEVNCAISYGYTALDRSCYNDSAEVTKLLISYGADVNFPGPYSAALFRCAYWGKALECMKVLLNAGVNVKGRKQGKSALYNAQMSGNEDMIKLLQPYFE